VCDHEVFAVATNGRGPFAGYESNWFFEPPLYGSWGYICLGTAYRQQNDRICGAANYTGSSKRMGCAITLLIRQACRWIGECDRVKTDRVDTERLPRSPMAYLRGEPKAWCGYPALPKKTRGGCTVSVIA